MCEVLSEIFYTSLNVLEHPEVFLTLLFRNVFDTSLDAKNRKCRKKNSVQPLHIYLAGGERSSSDPGRKAAAALSSSRGRRRRQRGPSGRRGWQPRNQCGTTAACNNTRIGTTS
jgi:hypothetical protein